MRRKILPFAPPLIGRSEIGGVVDCLRSGWLTTGPRTRSFEEAFAKYLGAPQALALSSGTAALHLALIASGIGEGDRVITTPLAFCASANVIEYVGARPVFVDVEPGALTIDPELVEKLLRSRSRARKIKAILPVHFAGHPCEMDTLLALARRYGLKVIEDAAHALPAQYKGRRIGTLGDMTAFSFYATKNMTTAEGGMLTGPSRALKKARILSLHGMDRNAWGRDGSGTAWRYEVMAQGFKYNMPDVLAAIGIAQLKRLSTFHRRRRQIADRYSEAFSRFGELQVPAARPEIDHAWHLYVLRLHLKRLRISRDLFIEELRKRRIGASVHFLPLHHHAYFRKRYGCGPRDFPVASREYERVVSLPIYPKMTDRDIRDVIEAVTEIVRRFGRPRS